MHPTKERRDEPANDTVDGPETRADPQMVDAIREELQAFVELRKEQGGAPTGFQ